MKKSNKKPRIVVAVLATLLIIGGLILLRSYLLSAYIGADTLAGNVIKQKSTLDGTFSADTISGDAFLNGTSNIRLKPNYSAQCPATLIKAAAPSASAIPTATTSTFTCPTISNITVEPNLTGGTTDAQKTKFYRGVNATALASGTAVSFKDRDANIATVSAPGLKIGTHPDQGYLQVSFSGQAANTFVEGSLDFTGAYLTTASVIKNTNYPIESNDTFSVDTLNNKVKFHFISSGTSDNDTILIYFCCGQRVASTGTVEGSIALNKAYIPYSFAMTFVGANGTPDQSCTRTDIKVQRSANGTDFNEGATRGATSIWEFTDQTTIKGIKYVLTLKSCNSLDTPRLRSIQLRGLLPTASKVPSATATCTANAGTVCPAQYSPVCGKDGKTYSNSCEAAKVCAQIASTGVCPKTATPTASATASAKASAVVSKTATVFPSPTPVGTLTYPPVPNLTPSPTDSIVPPPNPPEPTESLAPGQSPQPSVTPTVVVIDRIFNPQGSAGQFLASGIKSGPSFWIFIIVVAGIGGYIVYRIAISKE